MSAKLMKGFLIFTVVFFFVVVGLVGLTVVMKRHENAQIAKEDKTLVAPDPQKIQRLVEGIVFDNEDMPEKEKPVARMAVTALLKACPRIANLMTHNEVLSVSYVSPFEEWRGTKAYFYVRLHLTDESQKMLSDRFRAEEGYAGFGLRGGGAPGALVIWPLDHWLCNVPDDKSYREINEAVNKKKIPYKDLMRFIPLKDIPPNSF